MDNLLILVIIILIFMIVLLPENVKPESEKVVYDYCEQNDINKQICID